MNGIKKTGLLTFLLAGAFAAGAQQKQSLKDLLYSGKLKSDSGSVVRNTDDLSTKIDTATRKPAAEPAVAKQTTATKETTVAVVPQTDSVFTGTATTAEQTATTADATETAAATTTEGAAPAKSNTKVWKEYTESLLTALKSEVLSNKKIKKETYYVIVEYELGTDGAVTVGNVTSSPENALLQSEIKTRLDNTPPQLSPVLDSTGKARKLKRKHSFTVVKE